MFTNVRGYTDKELLNRVREVGGVIPKKGKYLIIGVQSLEGGSGFDDKFYVFDGPNFVMVSSGTTNTGKYGLLHFDDYNKNGVIVWKTDMFYKDLFVRGYHRPSRKGGGMRALRQVKPIWQYRDSNKNLKAEEIGEPIFGIYNTNMHGISYNPFSEKIGTVIGRWSLGCMVWNGMSDYRHMVNAVWKRNKPVDFCLLKEFNPKKT